MIKINLVDKKDKKFKQYVDPNLEIPTFLEARASL